MKTIRNQIETIKRRWVTFSLLTACTLCIALIVSCSKENDLSSIDNATESPSLTYGKQEGIEKISLENSILRWNTLYGFRYEIRTEGERFKILNEKMRQEVINTILKPANFYLSGGDLSDPFNTVQINNLRSLGSALLTNTIYVKKYSYYKNIVQNSVAVGDYVVKLTWNGRPESNINYAVYDGSVPERYLKYNSILFESGGRFELMDNNINPPQESSFTTDIHCPPIIITDPNNNNTTVAAITGINIHAEYTDPASGEACPRGPACINTSCAMIFFPSHARGWDIQAIGLRDDPRCNNCFFKIWYAVTNGFKWVEIGPGSIEVRGTLGWSQLRITGPCGGNCMVN